MMLPATRYSNDDSGGRLRGWRIATLVFLAAGITAGSWSMAAGQVTVCSTCHAYGTRGSSNAHLHGVGNCNMCHVMHNSQDGFLVGSFSADNSALLLRDTASDVCLMCHAGDMGNVFGSDPTQPPPEVGAGNFCFLTTPNLNDGPDGATNHLPGHHAGHSIVARSFNVTADPQQRVSPGGNFPARELGCTSCHDPHGNGNYRMLNGQGPVQGGLYQFTEPAPDASGISIYHGREGDRHNAYRSGFSAWCANCHEGIHGQGTGTLVHPVDVPLGNEIATAYNEYNGTMDITGGEQVSAYLPAVPFESTDASLTSTYGATADSRVMCLTCHRAHASSAPDGGRWDFNLTYLAVDGVVSSSYPLPNPYGDPGQRSLCNKCHAKDAYDRPTRDPSP
jgi:predicted CXXCH cytochrome family protein